MFSAIPLVNTEPKYIQPKRKVLNLKLLRLTRIMMRMIQWRPVMADSRKERHPELS